MPQKGKKKTIKRSPRKRAPLIRVNASVNRPGFGGTITHLRLGEAQDFKQPIQRPIRDANYSVSQVVNAFGSYSGISNGSTSYPPYLEALASTNQYFAIGFELGDLNQYSTLTALFDQYRFEEVEISFTPNNNAINQVAASTSQATVPLLYGVLDFDDATAPTSLAQVIEYDSCQIAQAWEGLHFRVRPSLTPAIYATGAFTGYGVSGTQWLDCNSATIPHYGIKGLVTALAASATTSFVWSIRCKYIVSFRNTR